MISLIEIDDNNLEQSSHSVSIGFTLTGMYFKNLQQQVILLLEYANPNIIFDWQTLDREGTLSDIDSCVASIFVKEKKILLQGKFLDLIKVKECSNSRFTQLRDEQFKVISNQPKKTLTREQTVIQEKTNKIYHEVVFENSSSQNNQESLLSIATIDDGIQFPAEFLIIKDLIGHHVVVQVEAMLFNQINGEYSYIVPDKLNRNLIKLTQLSELTRQTLLRKNFLEYAYSLLQLQQMFEEKNIIHSGLSLSSFSIHKETKDLILTDLSSLYYANSSNITNKVTSIGFISPEDCVNQCQTPKSNLFKIGIILYNILIGKNPFDYGDNKIYEHNVKFNIAFENLKDLDEMFKNFFTMILTIDSNLRPSANQLLTHSIFQPNFRKKMSKQTLNQIKAPDFIELEPSIQMVKDFRQLTKFHHQ